MQRMSCQDAPHVLTGLDQRGHAKLMAGEPNYLRRLILIGAGFLGGFTLIIVDGWALIIHPDDTDSWPVWLLRRLPVLIGIFCVAGAFFLLRKPVENDPGLPDDDIENMDGA